MTTPSAWTISLCVADEAKKIAFAAVSAEDGCVIDGGKIVFREEKPQDLRAAWNTIMRGICAAHSAVNRGEN